MPHSGHICGGWLRSDQCRLTLEGKTTAAADPGTNGIAAVPTYLSEPMHEPQLAQAPEVLPRWMGLAVPYPKRR
jgi:hypothetical protein